MAAPAGNTNSAKGREWANAIKRALAKRSRSMQIDALDELAEKLLGLCDMSDLGALKELGDRLDGKASQPLEGADGGNLVVEILRLAHPATE